VSYVEPQIDDGALGIGASPANAALLAKLEHTEQTYFRRRVRTLLSTNRVKLCFEKGWARSDSHLIEVATRERADLVVVGANERRGLSRIAHHSVSRGILHYAPMNVACIPSTTRQGEKRDTVA
jgi:hypothetical protein